MDVATLSALAALTGSLTGGLASLCGSWITQNAHRKADLAMVDKTRRQELYRDFIIEASGLYVDALTHDKADLSKTIAVYALVSRMRVYSASKVVTEAERIVRLIVDTYPEPNKTFSDVRVMIDDNIFDPLRAFAELCREELRFPASG